MKLFENKSKNLIFFIISFISSILLYLPILLNIFSKIINREESSYGLIIPFVSLYFIWNKRLRLQEIKKKFSLMGSIPLGIAIFFYFFHIGNERFYFQSLSFIIVVSCLLIFFMGMDFFKEISFPVLLLISLIPIPHNVYLGMANILREINLSGALWIISLTRIPFIRENLCVHLANSVLSVNIGCSGIRYFLSYFFFGIVYAYLFRKKLIDRLLVIVLTLPIAILAGILRLTVIFLSVHYIGAFMGEYIPHLIVSWAVFFIIGITMIILDRYIMRHNCLKQKEKPSVSR